MNPSTKRALRTGYQAVIALIVIIPVLLTALPVAAQVTAVVGAVAAVAKVLNALEDAGLIPAWLKADPAETQAAEVADGTPVAGY
jgi:hypothetical protein